MKTNIVLAADDLSVLIQALENIPQKTENQVELLEMMYSAFEDCRPDVIHDFTL